jgi:hypothetical protein
MITMKAISLWQPWASAIALGLKQYETRGWKTSYRGPLAIHAAKRSVDGMITSAMIQDLLERGVVKWRGLPALPLGCIVATCRLVDFIPTSFANRGPLIITEQERRWGDWSPCRWAWRLEDVRPLVEPFACRGKQGLWTVEFEPKYK